MLGNEKKEEFVKRICDATDLSRSTVYRFFANQHIKESSKNKIIQAMKEIDQSVESGNDYSGFEIVISVSAKTFDLFEGFNNVFTGIIDQADKYNIPVRFEKSYKPQWKEKRGVIMIGKDNQELEDDCRTMKELGIPFLLVNRILDDPEISYVSVAVQQAAFDITCHLIDRGYTRIAFWGEQNSLVSRQKFNGYKEALESRGIPFDPSIVETDPANHSLDETFSRLMSMKDRPDAFFSMDDATAIRLTRLAFEQGISVPSELGISGMNDLSSAHNVIPSISSVKIDFYTIGHEAVSSLIKLMRNDSIKAIKLVTNYKLMLRDSTKGKGKSK